MSVSIGLVERPLALGLLAGWFTGRWDVALPLAVTLELFWLDVIRLGAVVPPMSSLAYLLLLPLVLLLDLQAPQQLGAPLLLCLGCAQAAGWLERWERCRSNVLAEKVLCWSAGEGGGLSPERAVALSLGAQALLRYLAYVLCYTALYGVLSLAKTYALLPVLPNLSWNILYGLGFMGAVLAMRTRRAYAVLVGGLLLVLLSHI